MAKVQPTESQQQAVLDRGGSLLVSAAAGSGKTKVLVERLFAHMQEQRCHVDDFLIITYTKAAAAELRSKIAQELSRRVAEDPGNAHLRRQMFRVYQADIKTVDAFCASLLRQNVHLLAGDGHHSLTPDFRVLDEPESLLMKQRVLNAFSEIQEDTVLVCHGGVIAAIMEHLFPNEGKSRYEWQPKNGKGYCLKDGTYFPL